MPPLPTEPTLWTEIPITVSTSDIVDLPVMLRPGIRVTGTVQFDGSAARPEGDRLTAVGVILEPADVRPGVNSARGRVETSGRSRPWASRPAGTSSARWARPRAGPSWRDARRPRRHGRAARHRLGGERRRARVHRSPIELSGRVTGDANLTEGATVILFPTDQSAWVGYGSSTRRLPRNVRADKTGAFTIGNLPAGGLHLAAVTEKIAVDWQNPEFLASLASDATRVRPATARS